LAALWQLALANNPSLRGAEADVEAARGAQFQAGRYPNPHFLFNEDTIGSRIAPPGNMSLQITQEIVTGGKRRLDMGIAARETDAAALAHLNRRFEVLTRLRRAYYAYLGAVETAEVNESAAASLQKAVATTGDLVKVGKTPRYDLLRMEALLEETKINYARSRFNVQSTWKQVAAEVGLPELPLPEKGVVPEKGVGSLKATAPFLESEEVWQRVQAANSGLQLATVEVEAARLGIDRARAEAIPNVTVGAGYVNAAVESTAGAIITVETPLPLWDCKQGHIHEAQARWAKAEANLDGLRTSLSATVADAFARYQGARRQVEKLEKEVLPRYQDTVDALLKNLELGGANVAFIDVVTSEQSLISTRLTLVEARQALWQAVADLEGLMQFDISEDCRSAFPG
jgi:cobalt-zinc-cadmium efflux system outer membrane protein